jgi:hypothetical protein
MKPFKLLKDLADSCGHVVPRRTVRSGMLVGIAVGAILALICVWRAVLVASMFNGSHELVVSAVRQARVSSCTKAGAETECAIVAV